MKPKDIIVIGGGASGMMAAAKAAENGASVLLIEKMERLGRKVRITGKGRCNITNMKPWDEFSSHIFPKNMFFKPAFYFFSNTHTLAFFEKIGLKTNLERGERVYPASDKAQEVVEKLQQYLEKLNVEILLNTPYIQDLIFKGEVGAIKEAMKKGKELGMQTFDQALFDHYENEKITFEDAMRNADSVTDLKLSIKLASKRGRPEEMKGSTVTKTGGGLQIMEH